MIQARLTEWQLLTGRNEAPPEQRPLQAGPLTMVFEADDLRYLKLVGREVIRRIYAAVRDQNWGTVLSEIFARCLSRSVGQSTSHGADASRPHPRFRLGSETLFIG